MSGAFLSELESLFGWVVEASWQASILAALVLLLKWALRGRLNPRWHHALWLLVVARLLLPILPESALSLFQFAPAPPPAIARTVREPIFASPPEVPAQTPRSALPAPPAHYPYSAFTVLALIWLTGALVLLILTWQVNRRFIRHVRNAPRITDRRICHLAETARNELGVRRRPRIIESAQVQSPAIMGLLSPTLILPAEVSNRFSDDELRFIFLHEFAHLKRGDLFLQWLVALQQIVHWFNPVLWYAFRRMRADREPATDALVLSRTGEAQKESYGHVLVKLLEHHQRRHALPTLVGILEDKDQFKRRFLLIARFTRGAYGWSLLGILLVVILGVVCLTKSKGATTPKTLNSAVANSQLLEAVQKGDAAAMQKLIGQAVDPNKVEDHGRPLIFAAGSPTVAEVLLQHGANPNARDGQNSPALCFVLANQGKQATAIARVLLEHGADPNIRDGGSGETPLMCAPDGEAVDLLIQHGADINLKMTNGFDLIEMAGEKPLDYFQALLRYRVPFDVKEDGPTILLHASWVSNLPIMKEMIDRGVDPNAEGVWAMVNGKPQLLLPMRAAAIHDRLDSATFLLAHGAKADEGMIAALHNRNEELVKLFWERGTRNISSLSYQISQGAPISDLSKLLDSGVPADPPEDTIITPLGEAAQLGNMEAVQLLIAHGADVNAGGKLEAKDPEYAKWTPLSLAAAEGQDEVITYLLQHGAKPDPAAIYWGGTNSYPYPEQRSKDHFEKTIRLLIDAGALKNISPDMAGLVLVGPIQTRIGEPNPTVLKMLLDAGVSPESPMPYLAESGKKPNSVIGHYREYCKDPIYAQTAATFKPLLDMLEAADKGAVASATDLNVQLLAAVQKGDAAAVQKLIDQGVDPNKVEDQGQPLIFSAESPEAVEVLLQHGANPNARDSYNTPVLYSVFAKKGKQANAIARVLLEHGADPNLREESGATPLMAAQDGDSVDLLIQHGADIHLKMKDGRGVLDAAASYPLDYFKALLRHGVPFDVKKDGPSVLFRASMKNNLPMMEEMIDRGVDPNVKGVWYIDNGNTHLRLPIEAATFATEHPDAVTFLLAHGAKGDAGMVRALLNRNNALVKVFWNSGVRSISELCYQISQGAPLSELAKLLDAGLTADPPQDTEITPLGEAAQLGNMAAVKLLVEHKANVNASFQHDSDARMLGEITPLCEAAAEGNEEIVAYLLQNGAKPGPEAVYLAANNSFSYPGSKDNFEKTVRILIDAGALKNISPDVAGFVLAAPIWTRMPPPNATVLKILLDAGLSPESPLPGWAEIGQRPDTVIGALRESCRNIYDPSALDRKPLLEMLEAADKSAGASAADLDTQLLNAVQKGDAAAVQKLIGQGVDPNKVEDQGRPLIFAAGNAAVAQILLQHGADPNARDTPDDPVLCFVLLNKFEQATAIARVLLEHGADPNVRWTGGRTPLMAARTGDAVDLLVQHGADIHLKMPDGRGVLFTAGDSSLDYFQALLRYGVPFDAQKDGPTILQSASGINNLPMMKEMIDRGVDPNVKGVFDIWKGKPEMRLPIRAAAMDDQLEAAKFLLAHGAKADGDMLTALRNRNNRIVKLFWENGVRTISELCYQISQGAPASELVKLLDAGMPADPPQDTEITPLGEAAQLGNMGAVKLLIDHKANVNAGIQKEPKAPMYEHTTPLCLAAAEGQDEIVAYLLQHGATPDPVAVHEAAFNSSPYPEQRSKDHFENTVRILIDAGALKNISPDMAGNILISPVWTRLVPPNATVLRMLLDAGLSPESPVPWRALMGLKPNSVIGSVREACTAPINAQSAAKLKPLLEMLEAADKSPSASATDLSAQLRIAVQKGDAEAVQKLIGQGVDPNKVEDQGRPLLFAAGSAAVAEILLQHGANPNARNSDNAAVICVPLWSEGAQAITITRVLLEHGADPNIRSGTLGETPLMYARHGDAVDLLIQHGAEIHLKMTNGDGVLATAATKPLDYFQALIRHGVLFDAEKDGPTILVHASWFNNLPIMKEMIDRGVNPNAEGVWSFKNGKPDLMTPIRAAAVDNQPEAAKFLLAHGAKADADMITALRNRNNTIVKLFWENGVRSISELCYQISQGAPASELSKLLDAGVPADPPQDTEITPLAEAAQLGNMPTVRLLIERKANVNAGVQRDTKDPEHGQNTPLCLAAAEGQDEIIACLLQQGATPDPRAVYTAGYNSYPYPEQRSKDHFEKTVRILIDAGALKNISPEMAGLVLAGPVWTRQGPPNLTVLKMVLDAGVSPESPEPYLAEDGLSSSIIGSSRQWYKKLKDDPAKDEWAATFKPVLDMLEAAD